MKCSLQGKSYFVKFTILFLIAIFSFFGIYVLLSLYTDFFNSNKILIPILLLANIKMDFLGAIVPLFVGLACVAIYLNQGFSKIIYVACFLSSLTLVSLTSEKTPEALMSSKTVFPLAISAVTIGLVIILKKLKKESLWEIKEIYIASLLIVSSCAPFSKIAVDLCYINSFINPVIGGNGMADGILLSTMISPLIVTFIISLLAIFLLAYSQLKIKID